MYTWNVPLGPPLYISKYTTELVYVNATALIRQEQLVAVV